MYVKASCGKRLLAVLLVLTLVLGSVFCTAMSAQAYAQEEEAASAQNNGGATFSWDNATVYFLLTDRFYNGNEANDHSYGRGLDQNGNVVSGVDPSATFHGGDFAGITQKIEEGYFTDLGVNAIWLSAPYEQIHGYVVGGDSNPSFPHYAYHGYYAMDYTQTDANFGTAEEFQTLVDTAHAHGIRIIMDIVLNHSGYNTIQDMAEYNFGTLKNGWESYYYSHQNVNNTTYHSYIDYDSDAQAWGRWWGDDWVRAGLAGYGGSGSGEVQGSLSGLPDFKTESAKSVSVPMFLQEKWREEGRYNTEMQKLDDYFSSTGKSRTVTNYLAFWLSEWVRQYGVDGFRCDTAKHVEMASWANLKEECVKALREWKANNPDKALDDLDFWMTGEVWDHGVSKDQYYTEGKFDSIINFSTQGGGLLARGNVGNIYDYYANAINNDPEFNVLSYVSSHDTVIATGDKIHLGSAFLLLPGAVQIYYGDESDRPVMSNYQTNGDHEVRGDMNWNSMNTATLEHWQTVGRFRNNHISVGGGANTALASTSGYGFARTYDKNGISDRIAAVIDANTNTDVTLTVASIWEDGQELVNAYDGSSATVQNGKITFNSGKNGTILLEEPDGKPIISLDGESSFTGTQDVTVTLKEADYAVASVDGANKIKVYDGSTITIGETAYPGDTVKVTITAQNAIGTTTKTFSFTKRDPNQSAPADHAIVHVQQPEGYSGNPLSLYLWQDNGGTVTEPLGAWPGTKLTEGTLEDGWYTFELSNIKDGYSLIVNASGQPQSGDVSGLSGEVWIEVEATSTSITASRLVEDPEDSTPLGKLKKEAREVKNLMAEEFTSATISPVLQLVAEADVIIAKGENATESEITQKLSQLQAAKEALRLKAPYTDKVQNGATTISGSAACESVVTVTSGGKTYTAQADMFTGKWSVVVAAVTNADAVTVSCTKGDYISATVKANESTVDPPIIYPTDPTPTDPEPTEPSDTSEPTQPAYGTYIIGDVDGNGDVELNDVLIIQNYMAFKRALNAQEFACADVDENGKVELVDVLEIQKYLAKMQTSCDIGKVVTADSPTDPATTVTDPQPTAPQPTQPMPTDPDIPQGKTVYLNNAENWNTPYAYYWNQATDQGEVVWPGVAMEQVEGSVYRVTVPDDCDRIIFSNNGTPQTDDLSIPNGTQIYNNQTGAWSVYGGQTEETGGNTIYVQNNKGWGSVYAHYWEENDVPTTWPGRQMTDCGDGRYSLVIPKKYTNIVFSDNGGAQTGDLKIPGDQACFDLNSNSWK